MNKMVSLENCEWKEFFIEDIAHIEGGNGITKEKRLPGSVPYITSSSMNNGVTDFVYPLPGYEVKRNCISVNSNGSVGYSFYHPYDVLISGDAKCVIPEVNNKYVSLFLVTQITAQKEKYNYGYKMGEKRMKRQKIMLPVNEEGYPDYAFMEEYIRELEHQILENYVNFLDRNIQTQGG